jgi:hypothetical protein
VVPVCFESGLIVDYFSNTLRLKTLSASGLADILAAAVTRDGSTEVANNEVRNMISENEAAANDIEMEEHLPELPELDQQEKQIDKFDNDDLIVGDNMEQEEEAGEQRPVGVLLEVPDIGEPTTYAGRKEAAQSRIAALLGKKVTIQRGRTKSLQWVVIKLSIPDTVEEPK